MRKILILALLTAVVLGMSYGMSYAADWSRYESGRDNIRLDGYQGQPGYIEFTDGSGTTLGYLWMSADRGLLWCTAGAINLTTTKLSDPVGQRVSTRF